MSGRSAAAALTLAILAASCASSRQGLHYDLGRGDRFTLTVERQEVRERTFGENRMVDTTVTRSVDHFEIMEKRPDAVRVTIEYDERSIEPSNGEPPDFGPLRGHRASFWLDRTGTVDGFDGFLALPMIPVMGEGYSAKQYEMELHTLFPHLPEEALSPGSRWHRHVELEDVTTGTTLDVVMDFDYTLVGPAPEAPELLAIDCTYTASITGPVDGGNFFLDLDLSGEGTAEIRFDPVRSMITSSTGKLRMEGAAANEEVGLNVPLRNEHITEIRASF